MDPSSGQAVSGLAAVERTVSGRIEISETTNGFAAAFRHQFVLIYDDDRQQFGRSEPTSCARGSFQPDVETPVDDRRSSNGSRVTKRSDACAFLNSRLKVADKKEVRLCGIFS